MEISKLKNILEAILLAADRTLTVVQLEALFELDEERPTRDEIRQALHEMTDDYAERGYELKQVASGFRLQVKQDYATWVSRLWEEKPARYTRALLETMALIAYRQPITRGEIEEVRGVSVSSNIIKTLLERDWVKVLGHKDVPGKPTLYGTTKEFLDYFNLKSLDQLPTLAEIKDLDSIHPELELDEDAVDNAPGDSSEAADGDSNDDDIQSSADQGDENDALNDDDDTEDVIDNQVFDESADEALFTDGQLIDEPADDDDSAIETPVSELDDVEQQEENQQLDEIKKQVFNA